MQVIIGRRSPLATPRPTSPMSGMMSSALGAQHVGRRVNVFFAEPAPGASYLGRLLYYLGGEFFVQWLAAAQRERSSPRGL